MKQVMNYHKDNGLLNMIRRTDPMIILKTVTNVTIDKNNGIKWDGFMPTFNF